MAAFRLIQVIATATRAFIEDKAPPSLYPLYIPYKTQFQLLTRVQRLLEECCYAFTLQWMPDLLEQRQWDCSEAIELQKWTFAALKRTGKLPSHCFASQGEDSTMSLADVFLKVNKLRHSAVHRIRTTAKGISEMIQTATRFARALGDLHCEQQLDEMQVELEGKIRALELNKNFLENRLEKELQDIEMQRRALDEQEKAAVATMVKEDSDYVSQIGGLLSESINTIFDKRLEESQLTEGEQTVALETEYEQDREQAEDDKVLSEETLDPPFEAGITSNQECVADSIEPSNENDQSPDDAQLCFHSSPSMQGATRHETDATEWELEDDAPTKYIVPREVEGNVSDSCNYLLLLIGRRITRRHGR